MKTIRISCEGAGLLPVDLLRDFQGNLKDLSKENYQKLKNEILEQGFSEPVSVWRNDGKYHLLNGHQRVRTLKAMHGEGYKIPEIPVNWVEADNQEQAKKKVLALTSQYGNMTHQGLYEFIMEANIDVEYLETSVSFPEVKIEQFKANYFDEAPTTQEITTPNVNPFEVPPEGAVNQAEEDKKKNGPVHQSQFIIAIECESESEMRVLYEELFGRGYACKLIT